jgi:hypothetical protein
MGRRVAEQAEDTVFGMRGASGFLGAGQDLSLIEVLEECVDQTSQGNLAGGYQRVGLDD